LKIRKNNIGVEPVQYLGNPNDQGKEVLRVAIVKYHKNRYFGLMDEYLQGGWEDKGDFIQAGAENYNTTLSKNCFKDPETHYVIAFLHLHPDEEETELESVGDRLLYIEEEDKKDFFEVYSLADRFLQKSHEEKLQKDSSQKMGQETESIGLL